MSQPREEAPEKLWGRWEGQEQEGIEMHNQGLCVVSCSSESPWVSQHLSSRYATRASRDAGALFHSHSAWVFKMCLACGTVSQVAKEKEWLCRGPSQVCLVTRACTFLWGLPNPALHQWLPLDPRKSKQFSEMGSPNNVLWKSHLSGIPLNFKRKRSVFQADVSNLSIVLWRS